MDINAAGAPDPSEIRLKIRLLYSSMTCTNWVLFGITCQTETLSIYAFLKT